MNVKKQGSKQRTYKGKNAGITKFFHILFTAIFIGQITPAAEEKPAPDKIIPYKKVGNAVLTLHIFNPPEHKVTDKAPAIVFFFGGGWIEGLPSHFYCQSKYLASRGMVSICADYRTFNRFHTAPDKCVEDGKSAMRWVRSHAAELGIDPNRLAAGGGSAGGHIAAATALITGFNAENEDISISCRPNALVLFNPVIDNGPKGYGYDRVKTYWKTFSPLNNISKNNPPPPTLFQVGTKDNAVPVQTAELYKQLSEEAGSRCDLILYKDQPHGFFNQTKYYETLLQADNFLTSLGYLKGTPTLNKKAP